jgi:polysaccharide export outer membrane protein
LLKYNKLKIKDFSIKAILTTSIIFLISFTFVGCTIKDDRLFQRKSGIVKTNPVVKDTEYKDEVTYEYKIATNDRLSIIVYVQSGTGTQQMNSILANSDTTRQGLDNIDAAAGLLVTQKGEVRLPLIGSIKVAGLTEDEAANALITEYQRFIRDPYVTVEITNQRIIVIGEVKNPGIIPVVNGTMNLIEVISRSGYFTENASRTNIQIIRGDLRNPKIKNIDLTNGKSLLTTSLLLQPNDIVYIQARQLSGINKAFTETLPFLGAVSAILNPFVQFTNIKLNKQRLSADDN